MHTTDFFGLIPKIILFLASTMSTVMTGETIDANAGQFISF